MASGADLGFRPCSTHGAPRTVAPPGGLYTWSPEGDKNLCEKKERKSITDHCADHSRCVWGNVREQWQREGLDQEEKKEEVLFRGSGEDFQKKEKY